MRTAARRSLSAQKLFRRVARSARLHPISEKRSSPHPSSLGTMKRQSIANPLLRCCKLVPAKKPKQPALRPYLPRRHLQKVRSLSALADALETLTAPFQPTIGPRGGRYDSLATSLAKSAMHAASSQIGRQLVRGILGGILGGSTRRR